MLTLRPTQTNNYEGHKRLGHPRAAQPPACSHTTQDPTLVTLRDTPGHQTEGWSKIEIPQHQPQNVRAISAVGDSALYANGLNSGIACGYPVARYGVGMTKGGGIFLEESHSIQIQQVGVVCALAHVCTACSVECGMSDGFCICDIGPPHGCCAVCVVCCMFEMSGMCVYGRVCDVWYALWCVSHI